MCPTSPRASDRRFAVDFVEPASEGFGAVLELWFTVLYEPFGLPRPLDPAEKGAEWMAPEPGTRIAVAIGERGELLGAARLLPSQGDLERQVRQVAVSCHVRGRGVGRALMLALEAKAAEEGADAVWLNARATAYAFYERLGYRAEGDTFISEVTGIEHRRMRKRLG